MAKTCSSSIPTKATKINKVNCLEINKIIEEKKIRKDYSI